MDLLGTREKAAAWLRTAALLPAEASLTSSEHAALLRLRASIEGRPGCPRRRPRGRRSRRPPDQGARRRPSRPHRRSRERRPRWPAPPAPAIPASWLPWPSHRRIRRLRHVAAPEILPRPRTAARPFTTTLTRLPHPPPNTAQCTPPVVQLHPHRRRCSLLAGGDRRWAVGMLSAQREALARWRRRNRRNDQSVYVTGAGPRDLR